MDKQSIFIPETITIIRNCRGAGFIVLPGNENMRETAINWATTYKDRNNFEEFTYENGKFILEILNAAGYSSCSGKLSFWTCRVIAQDGQTFEVGINSVWLCELIKSTDVFQGIIHDVYLGYGNRQQLATVKDSEIWNKAKEEEYKRTVKQTVKYVPGDIVETLTKKEIYLGTVYQYFSVHESNVWTSVVPTMNLEFTVIDKPKALHLFLECPKEGIKSIYGETFLKRPARRVTGHLSEYEQADLSQFTYIGIQDDFGIWKENIPMSLGLTDTEKKDYKVYLQHRIDSLKERGAEVVNVKLIHTDLTATL